MFRSLWFHKLLGLKSRSVRRRQAAQNRQAVRLRLEGLEDRVTPAVIDTTLGTGAALQSYITNVVNGDTGPNAANDTFNITLSGSSSTFQLSQQVNINSKAHVNIIGGTSSASGTVIDAANNTRAFEI